MYYYSWPWYDRQKDLARTSLRISCGTLVITPRTPSRPQVPGQHIAYVSVIKAFSLNQFVFYKLYLQDYKLVACCSLIYFIVTKFKQAYAHHPTPRNHAAKIQSNTNHVEQTLQHHSICPSGAYLAPSHSNNKAKKKSHRIVPPSLFLNVLLNCALRPIIYFYSLHKKTTLYLLHSTLSPCNISWFNKYHHVCSTYSLHGALTILLHFP